MSEPVNPTSAVPLRHMLFIEEAPTLGGDTKQGITLVEGLDRSLYQVTLVTSRTGQTYEYAKKIPGITHLTYEFGKWVNEVGPVLPSLTKPARQIVGAGRIALIAAKLALYAKRNGVTFVASGDRLRSVLLANLVAASTRLPQVFYPGCHLHGGSGVLRRTAAKRAALVIGNSRFTAESFLSLGIPATRTVAIHNALNPAPFERNDGDRSFRDQFGIARDAFCFGWVGRWSVWKGTDDLLDAMAIVHKKYPEVHLMMTGGMTSGGPLDGPRSNVKRLGLEGVVHITPHTSDVGKVYSAMDVFVMPSHDEPFGYVTIEAMASEKPVLGSTGGATPEIIVPDQTGRLFPPRDPVAMANAMIWMIENRDAWQGWGAASRKRVHDSFSPEQRIADFSRALMPFTRAS